MSLFSVGPASIYSFLLSNLWFIFRMGGLGIHIRHMIPSLTFDPRIPWSIYSSTSSLFFYPPVMNFSLIPHSTILSSQFDPYTAAQNSQFNVSRQGNRHNSRPRWGGSSSSYGGGGGGPGGSGPRGGGSGPRRIGRVDDIRAPECGSCR